MCSAASPAQLLSSGDEQSVLSVVGQLPMPPDQVNESIECYQVLMDCHRDFGAAVRSAFFLAVEREFQRKTLPVPCRLALCAHFVNQLLVSGNLGLLDITCFCLRHSLEPEIRKPVLAHVVALLRRADAKGGRIAGQLFRAAMKGGWSPDPSTTNLIINCPPCLRCAMKPLLFRIERSLPPADAAPRIVAIATAISTDSAVVDAVLSLRNPPRALLDRIAQAIRNNATAVSIFKSLLKHRQRVRELGIADPSDLFMIIVRAPALVEANPSAVLSLFSDLAAADIERLPEGDVVVFLRTFSIEHPREALDLCIPIAHKMPALAPLVAWFMASPEAVQHFDPWCRTFGIIIPFLPSNEQGKLYNHLKSITIRELQFGHVTPAPGIKVIQTQLLPRVGARILDIADQPEPGVVERPVIPVRGWRELSALLRLAPVDAVTLKLLNSALDVHSRALVPALVDVLNRFGGEAIVGWVGGLLGGNQQRQVMAIDVLVGTMDRHCEVRRRLIEVLANYMKTENTPELLKSKARRTLEGVRGRPWGSREREVIDALLPPVTNQSIMGNRNRSWAMFGSRRAMPPRVVSALISKGAIFLMANPARNRRMGAMGASQLPAMTEKQS